MKDGRKKILRLLEKGYIDASEAKNFLDIYDDYESTKLKDKEHPFIRIHIKVIKDGVQKVYVDIPIEFVGLLKTSKLRANIEEHDIDIDKIVNFVNEGYIGKIIEINDGSNDSITVYVE